MDENESRNIPKRLARIIQLAEEYYPMDKGALIEKHTELLRIVDVRGSEHEGHPHDTCRVYISRMALKHFIEERSAAFRKNHSEDEALGAICFAINSIPETVINYDRFEHEPKEVPPKFFYSKDYSSFGRPMLRILVEQKDETLEIRSIHFQTRNRQ